MGSNQGKTDISENMAELDFKKIIQEIQQSDRFISNEQQKENLIKVISYITHLKDDEKQYFRLNLSKVKDITGCDGKRVFN